MSERNQKAYMEHMFSDFRTKMGCIVDTPRVMD
jgi:hypothetical protein